jgi:uncharacterized protein YndB with AHSA1/START domain
MATFETNNLIRRPIEEVFAYVANPEYFPNWDPGVLEAKQTSAGPLGKGSTIQIVVKLLGRRMEMGQEVVAFEPNQQIGYKVTSGPFPVKYQYSFAPVEGGTKISGSAEIGSEKAISFFKLAEPIMLRAAKRNVETALANLKDLMEAEAA